VEDADQGKNIIVDLKEIELIAVEAVEIKDDQDGQNNQGSVVTEFPGGDPCRCGGN
jgi:hypothetical protein